MDEAKRQLGELIYDVLHAHKGHGSVALWRCREVAGRILYEEDQKLTRELAQTADE